MIQFGNQYSIINKTLLTLPVIDELLRITNVPSAILKARRQSATCTIRVQTIIHTQFQLVLQIEPNKRNKLILVPMTMTASDK